MSDEAKPSYGYAVQQLKCTLEVGTLKSGIVVLVGINILVGKLVGNNKPNGWNKHTGENNCYQTSIYALE